MPAKGLFAVQLFMFAWVELRRLQDYNKPGTVSLTCKGIGTCMIESNMVGRTSIEPGPTIHIDRLSLGLLPALIDIRQLISSHRMHSTDRRRWP